jgi:hypothetical protein
VRKKWGMRASFAETGPPGASRRRNQPPRQQAVKGQRSAAAGPDLPAEPRFRLPP